MELILWILRNKARFRKYEHHETKLPSRNTVLSEILIIIVESLVYSSAVILSYPKGSVYRNPETGFKINYR